MNFKDYINNHFRQCHEIGAVFNPAYIRTFRLFYIPGFPDDVGISDGVDSWVAVATSDILGINVVRIIQDILATGEIPVVRHKLHSK